MGKLEEKEGGTMLAYAAEKRMGTPEELGFAIATVADERNGYLAGVDVLVDGAAQTERTSENNNKDRNVIISAYESF